MTWTARLATAAAAMVLLLAPALWNGFPLLEHDSGGYLARWFEGTLEVSRSTVYGLFLAALARPDFWPAIAVQAALTVWVIALTLRAHGLGGRPLVLLGTVTALAVATTLPWIASILLADIFAGLGVLALYLAVMRPGAFGKRERAALVVLAAFSAATHNATLAVLAGLLVAAGVVALWQWSWERIGMGWMHERTACSTSPRRGEVARAQRGRVRGLPTAEDGNPLTPPLSPSGRGSRPVVGQQRAPMTTGSPLVRRAGLARGLAALLLGPIMLVAANYAVSGRLAWTPGGIALAFGRMLQDGIVARYLADRCPDPRFKLCDHRDELPNDADVFFWGESVFDRLGRFEGLAEEMRTIVLESIAAYPLRQVEAAASAAARQLVKVATGEGVLDSVWHSHGMIENFAPSALPAMRAARQQQGKIDFTAINRLHVPVALASMVLLIATIALALGSPRYADLTPLAMTAALAILSNAAVCGVLANPHDRYGARLAWIATLVVVMAGWRALMREPGTE